jgi:hypothetical protein
MTLNEGAGSTNTKPPGSDTWGADEDLPLPQDPRLAVAPDGSAVAVAASNCGGTGAPVPCLVAAFRPADGLWGEVEPIAAFAAGRFTTGFEVASTPASSFSVVWGEAPSQGNSGSVRSADRAPGDDGGWAAPETIVNLASALPGCRGADNCFDVATGPDGRQLAAWRQGSVVAAALRPAGGAWDSPETAGLADSTGAIPFAALTAAEVPVLAWGTAARGQGIARGAHRNAAGWQAVALGPPPGNGASLGDLVADGQGNAVTAWGDVGGVEASGFDGAGPRFSAFSLPSGSLVAAPFSAAAADDWSQPTSIAWAFGDGAGAPGASVTHAYGAAGTFTATATATDAIGNATTASGTVTVTAEPTPTPNPCGTTDKDKDGINNGCDTNDGSRRPVAFKTVNAKVVSGEVFVKLPAGAARASQAKPPKGFVRLTGAQTIPVGSTLDTAKGRVSLRTASDTRRHVQRAQFFRGRFLIRQVRKPRGKARRRSTKLITELRLTGSSFAKACKAKASISAKRRSKKRVRRLFGDGKGSFRTRGRNAAATVRGTRWGVQDRCDGTLVTVQRGRVQVRDLVRRRTVTVRTGHTYLARRR